MKLIHFLIFCILYSSNLYAESTVDTALETSGIRVEYFESSRKGVVYVKGCEQCSQKFYKFSDEPRVKRKGKYISFEEFMTDYRNAEHPTIFLDKRTRSVRKILY